MAGTVATQPSRTPASKKEEPHGLDPGSRHPPGQRHRRIGRVLSATCHHNVRWRPARCAACSSSSPTPRPPARSCSTAGVECSEITVFSPDDGGTFFGFSDPDSNTWGVQELKVRNEKPLIPVEHRGRFGA
jgi:hypothetical protein